MSDFTILYFAIFWPDFKDAPVYHGLSEFLDSRVCISFSSEIVFWDTPSSSYDLLASDFPTGFFFLSICSSVCRACFMSQSLLNVFFNHEQHNLPAGDLSQLPLFPHLNFFLTPPLPQHCSCEAFRKQRPPEVHTTPSWNKCLSTEQNFLFLVSRESSSRARASYCKKLVEVKDKFTFEMKLPATRVEINPPILHRAGLDVARWAQSTVMERNVNRYDHLQTQPPACLLVLWRQRLLSH